jgi:hypothetical protein
MAIVEAPRLGPPWSSITSPSASQSTPPWEQKRESSDIMTETTATLAMSSKATHRRSIGPLVTRV